MKKVYTESYRSGFAPVLTVILLAILIAAVFLFYRHVKCPVADCHLINRLPSPSTITKPPNTDSQKIVQGNNETSNWKTYTNNYFKFSFKYPNDFATIEPPMDKFDLSQGYYLSLDSPNLSSGDLSTPIRSGGTIAIWINPAIGSLDDDLKRLESEDYRIRSKATTKLDGVTGYKGVGSFSGFNDGNFVITIKNGYSYHLYAKASERDMEEINKSFDQILSTFKFTE